MVFFQGHSEEHGYFFVKSGGEEVGICVDVACFVQTVQGS